MEAPDPSNPVEQIAVTAHHSRPGPVVGCGAGVFQSVTTGEYSYNSRNGISIPDESIFRTSNGQSSTPTIQHADNDDVLIYYQNAGGMNSTTHDYLLATSNECYDVIVLTETWLDSRTISSQVFNSEYDVFRCDRGPRNSRKSTGGGVLVAVNKKRKSKVIENDQWSSIEQVWVCIEFTNRKVFLCGIYVPPDRTRDDDLIERHTRSIMSVVEMTSACDEIIVIGDFNLPGISWQPSHHGFLHPDPDRSTMHVGATKLLDCYCSATLRQINHLTNENNRSLDLCFVSAQDVAPTVSIAPLPLVKQARHHPPLILTLNDRHTIEMKGIVPVSYDFPNADHGGIAEYFASIDWLNVLDGRDADEAALTLSNIIGHVIDRHVPKKAFNGNRKPWITRELSSLKTAKRAALRHYCKHRTIPLRDQYRSLNAEYKLRIRESFRHYQHGIQRNLQAKPKSFWSYVNSQRKESGFPSTMTLNGEVTSEPQKVSQLCEYFLR